MPFSTRQLGERGGDVGGDDLVVLAAEVGEELAVPLDRVGSAAAGQPVVVAHVHAEQLAARALRHARGAADQRFGSGCAGDRDEHPLARLPRLGDAVPLAIVLEPFVDAVGEPEQCELAERGEIAGAEVVRERGVDAIRLVDVAVRHAAAQRLRRHVDELDLVGAAHDVVGDRLALLHAGDALDHVVHRLEVLDVQRRDDVDPGIEELLDVLPALLVARPGNVRVRELVDQRDLGMARDHRVDVHLLELGAAVLDLAPRNELQIAELLRGAGPAVGLDEAHDHVGPALVAPAALVEHRERLAHAGCRTQIQAKLAPRHATSVARVRVPAGASAPYFNAALARVSTRFRRRPWSSWSV